MFGTVRYTASLISGLSRTESSGEGTVALMAVPLVMLAALSNNPQPNWLKFANIGSSNVQISATAYYSAVGTVGDSVWWMSCSDAETAAAGRPIEVRLG